MTRDIVTDYRHMPSSGYKEVDYMRKTFIDACRKRGFVLVVRQKITDVMFEVSENDPSVLPRITRCNRCYDSAYNDAADPACPVCFGSGYSGGYLPPVVTWGTVFTTGHDVTFTEGVGRFVAQTANTATLAFTPLILDGDLVAQVYDYDQYGAVGDPAAIYYVDAITHNPYQGKLKIDKMGVSDIEDTTVIYQNFTAKGIPSTDPRINIPFRMEG